MWFRISDTLFLRGSKASFGLGYSEGGSLAVFIFLIEDDNKNASLLNFFVRLCSILK